MTGETLTRFYTQRRNHGHGNKTDWEEVCSGHEDFYEAMRCHDGYRTVMLGGHMNKDNPLLYVIDSLIREDYRQFRRDGFSIELRLVKVTQTTEVAEPARFIEEEKITPKKEAP